MDWQAFLVEHHVKFVSLLLVWAADIGGPALVACMGDPARFAKAKQFRRFATRYEKLRSRYLGVVHLVLGFIRLRRLVNVNRP